jgi:hypothetical protein
VRHSLQRGVVVLCCLAVAGCGESPQWSSESMDRQVIAAVPGASSPVCDRAQDGRRVYLGQAGLRGDSPATGNSKPVVVSVPVGSHVTVIARFGHRELSYPAANRPILRLACHRHSGWSYATRYVAVQTGTARVEAHTSTCPPCAQLGFVAEVHVMAAAPAKPVTREPSFTG